MWLTTLLVEMTPTTPTSDRTDSNPTRRRFLQTATAAGVGLAALSSSSGTARARSELRDQYQILLGTPNEQTVYYYRAPEDGPTTMVVGGIHGDERSGYMAADQIKEWTVDRGELVVVPRAHPEAIADDIRPWDNDLNRKFPPTGGECLTALAQKLWDVVEHHDPDWVFDLHSSRGIYKSGDGGVGQAMFPTWTSPARSTGEKTVAALNDEFGLTGDMAYLMGNTLDADRDMLMHRVAGMLDRPGFLCETTEKAPLDDQIAWQLFTVEQTMAQYGQRRVSGTNANRNEIVIRGTGTDVRYEFKATESVTPVDEPEWNDYVYSRGINGHVSSGEDRFYFEGELEYFEVKEGSAADLEVYVNGDRLDVGPVRHEIVVQGSGPGTRYEFKATESVEPITEPEWNDYVYSRGINGHVSSGEDRFYFEGELEYFEVKEGSAADLTVTVDGREISAEPDTRTIQIDGTGPDVRYEFKATESVTPVDEPEWNDYVYSRGINGHVSSGSDRFDFVGDLEYFVVKEGSASDLNVYVDGLAYDVA
jgi:hypothetical protein